MAECLIVTCVVQFIIILALSGVVAWFARKSITDNKDPALPYLSRAPNLSSVGTSYAILEWSSEHEGDGPVCGYIVNLKLSSSSEDFKAIGFVPMIDVSDYQSLTFVIDRLQAHTEYMTTITLLHCSGGRGPPSPELYVYTSDFELPTLSRAPELSVISTSYAEIQWQSDNFNGDGPVCGYDVNIRNGDHDDPWFSVGFVTKQTFSSMTADSFRINDLDPSTEYEVVVGVVHCDGGRKSELRPAASFRTLDIVLPTLVETPAAQDIGASHVYIAWSGQHEGDGPVCGYAINIRQSLDGRDEAWASVGFIPTEDSPLFFNVTHLEPGTSYEIAVGLVHCGSGQQGPLHPLLAVNTNVAVLPTLVDPPVAQDTGASHVDIKWSGNHEGDGPVCGYAINIRKNLNRRDGLNETWSSVGFVPAEDLPLYFNVTHLEPGTSYEIAVGLVHCGSGQQGPLRSLLAVNTNITVLPTLVEPPAAQDIGASHVYITWSGQHEGDGPVCGYALNIRQSLDGWDWLNKEWSNVGFIPAEDSPLYFNVTHLEPGTSYEIAVGLVHCGSGQKGPLRPLLAVNTNVAVLPTLVETPVAQDIGTSHVDITWEGQHEGDGPVCGYAINIRQSLEGRDRLKETWSSVGFIPVEDSLLYFNVTNLEPGTSYEIAVVLVHCGSGQQGPFRPLLAVNTNVVETPSTAIAPSPSNTSSPNMLTTSGSVPVTVTSVLPDNSSQCPPGAALTAIQGNVIWKWLFIALTTACAIIGLIVLAWILLYRY